MSLIFDLSRDLSDTNTTLPSESPTSSPTLVPTYETDEPTVSPSARPTSSPEIAPTTSPFEEHTTTPSESPTISPTLTPTASPTLTPSASPSFSPTISPTVSPTFSPTKVPTESPTESPTLSPTASPTISPTISPTFSPTVLPTGSPTISPTISPSVSPSVSPSISPSISPSTTPSISPSISPSTNPTEIPSVSPTYINLPTTSPTPLSSAALGGEDAVRIEGIENPTTQNLAIALSTIVASFCFIICVLTYCYRNVHVIRFSHSTLLQMIFLGLTFWNLSIIPRALAPEHGNNGEAMCVISRIFQDQGYVIAVTPMVVKAYYIEKIFSSAFSKSSSQPSRFLSRTLILCLVEGIILLVWMLVSPPRVNPSANYACDSENKTFYYLSLAYQLIITLLGLYMTRKTRQLGSILSESRAMCDTMTLSLGVVVLISVFVTLNDSTPEVVSLLLSLSFAIVSVLATTKLLYPRYKRRNKDQEELLSEAQMHFDQFKKNGEPRSSKHISEIHAPPKQVEKHVPAVVKAKPEVVEFDFDKPLEDEADQMESQVNKQNDNVQLDGKLEDIDEEVSLDQIKAEIPNDANEDPSRATGEDQLTLS